MNSNDIAAAVEARWDSLTKPRGSLGVLESAVVRLAQIQNTIHPTVDRRAIYIFCGDHGITAEGVSPYPQAVTGQMMKNFVRGGAAINVLCRQLAIVPKIVDAGVAGEKIEGTIDLRIGNGTANFLQRSAMSEEEAEAALAQGKQLAAAAAEQFDIVGVGEMGIGNTTSASAIVCALVNFTQEEATGRGAGLDDAGLEHKRQVLKDALARRSFDPNRPLSVLQAFGGFEIAMMSGFLLGAADSHLPVVIDGFISSAAYLMAHAFSPEVADSVFFSHCSAEQAHRKLLKDLGRNPLLDLGLRLGEGTGAALAIGLLVSSVALYREMATFAEASVSDR